MLPASSSMHSSQPEPSNVQQDLDIRPLGRSDRANTTSSRRLRSERHSEVDLRSRMPPRPAPVDENTSLLDPADSRTHSYASVAESHGSAIPTPRPKPLSHHSYTGSVRLPQRHSRSGSFGQRLTAALGTAKSFPQQSLNLDDSSSSIHPASRVWYDQFTSTDWVQDSISDAYRVKALRSQKGLRGKLSNLLDAGQGWILVAIIGCIAATIAYFVDITETVVFDLKEGYCTTGWFFSRRKCCIGRHDCDSWSSWSRFIGPSKVDSVWIDFAAYVISVVALASLSSFLTLTSRTVVPSTVQLATLDENLAAGNGRKESVNGDTMLQNGMGSPEGALQEVDALPTVYYSAAGSGVAEVKVILSGFVLHGYLGVKTLVVKTLALIISVASGLSLGKEGPFVHIATCVGNIACRLFAKYNRNDGKRREVLSASAASGVAVAFGAPIGGVLFSLEEVSYYFPPKTLFRTFFCCIVAALSLKFLNPYGTNKIVLFEVRYVTDWRFFEMIAFIMLGVMGGALGALFIKASRFWARSFRRIPWIKRGPMFEVFLVALATGLSSFWNRYTRLPVAELLFELASPCEADGPQAGLCPPVENTPEVIRYLAVALVVKSILTIITFGIKVPAGIYVPSMVVGGLLGRMVGHSVQYMVALYPHAAIFGGCLGVSADRCITPGVYAMVAAGATMCGVTRLSVTLAVILFELTGSLDHVLPFSLAILVSKWTADAIEPLSIYDLLTDMNHYPFLDNKVRPVFTSELADITPRVHHQRIIDISSSALVPAKSLRRKVQALHLAGELDGGLPIVRHGVLVGLIPGPDLEFGLDKLQNEDESFCLMTRVNYPRVARGTAHEGDEEVDVDVDVDMDVDTADFGSYIDPSPVALDIRSSMDLVYECFVKLGLRYVCVLRDGQFAGLVHKKQFVKYVKELEVTHR
ncbi:MAG: hypothetical protein M1826_007214 [Phylliscum demangeonii]|nr:MAG: hypothetical protein M1826_007214 [Phylliscum demangeonii]